MARHIAEHVAAVRRIDPRLRDATALFVIENDNNPMAVATVIKELREQNAAAMGRWEPVHTERAISSDLKRKRGSGTDPEDIGLDRAFLTAAAADGDGRVNPGAKTGTHKPTMARILKEVMDERRLYFHAGMVAASGTDEEQYEGFQQELLEHSERELQALLHRVSAGGVQQRTPAFEQAYVDKERRAIRTQFYHELRGFRYIETVRPGRDGGEPRRWGRYTGKETDGPHGKRDDLVMSAAQAAFSMSCISTLDWFEPMRIRYS